MSLTKYEVEQGYTIEQIKVRKIDGNYLKEDLNKDIYLEYIFQQPLAKLYKHGPSSNWEGFYYIVIKNKKDDTNICYFKVKTLDGCCGSGVLFDYAEGKSNKLINKDFPKEKLQQFIIGILEVTQIIATNNLHNGHFDYFLQLLEFEKSGEKFFNPNSDNYVQNWVYLDDKRDNKENWLNDEDDDW